jgi:hypothetical protein
VSQAEPIEVLAAATAGQLAAALSNELAGYIMRVPGAVDQDGTQAARLGESAAAVMLGSGVGFLMDLMRPDVRAPQVRTWLHAKLAGAGSAGISRGLC